jgi:hypothetical protein
MESVNLTKAHAQLYPLFKRQEWPWCQCEKRASFLSGAGEAKCNMCINRDDWALPFDALDLLPEEVISICTGRPFREAAAAEIEEALASKEREIKLLRELIRLQLPEAGSPDSCAPLLALQVEGKRDVVEGRVLEGYVKMRDSWLLFQEIK